jgi:predicted secreted hydrolase
VRSSCAALCALLVLLASPGALQAAPGGFTSAGEPYKFTFPADHASHPAYRTEWWYYTGQLFAKDGRRFGYELTFFRIGLRPGDPTPGPGRSAWRGNELFPAHFAITDVNGGRFVHTQQIAREALGRGYASTRRLEVVSGTWSLRGVAPPSRPAFETMQLRASATIDGEVTALDLTQTPLKAPAIHGTGGVSRKGACGSCASHYYSYTRLQTIGSIVYRGERIPVEGTSWMDHEFGSGELQSDQVGWDWFSIQLADERELMLYVLRTKSGITPESGGSVIEKDGTVRRLALSDFTTRATGSWKSPHDGALYPSGWRVTIPSLALDLELTPLVLDQELSDASGISYWEGAVDVRAASGGASLGSGYVELTGYAGAVSL